ncbi:MAG: EamA family transporter [Parcubacteria group bacterium]|jgi:uncharacterized membrane protein
MSSGIIFAIIAAVAFGLWTVFHQQASENINALLGAIIVSLTAVILGMIVIWPKFNSAVAEIKPKGILFAVLAGISALAIDYFALKAYGSGLSVSVGGPIIIAGSIAIASVIGFFLGESVTILKIAGLVLIIAGSAILTGFSK